MYPIGTGEEKFRTTLSFLLSKVIHKKSKKISNCSGSRFRGSGVQG